MNSMTAADLDRAAQILGAYARVLRDSYPVAAKGGRRVCFLTEDAAIKREHDDCVRLARALTKEAKRRAA